MAIELSAAAWRVRRLAERAGPAGVAAVALCVLAALAWLVPGQAISRAARRLAQDNERLQRHAAAPARASSAPLSSERQLAAFEASFPDPQALGPSYARLWEVARRHGVALRQAEFRLSDASGDEFQRYAILLPVKADYPSLRAFVADALGALPSLALEEMSIKRGDAKSLQLEARLSFVLFVHRGSV